MQAVLYKLAGFGLNLWSMVAPQHAAGAASNLFATPPKPSLRDKEKNFLDTASQLRRQVAGSEIVEYHWGEENAPLVLLSYGWATIRAAGAILYPNCWTQATGWSPTTRPAMDWRRKGS